MTTAENRYDDLHCVIELGDRRKRRPANGPNDGVGETLQNYSRNRRTLSFLLRGCRGLLAKEEYSGKYEPADHYQCRNQP